MILNPITQKWLDAYIGNPSTALFIDTKSDPQTALEVAKNIYATLVPNGKSLVIITPEETKGISIDAVRELQHVLAQSADRSSAAISRIVCLYEVHRMSTEAQNAFLKTLEELPQRTAVILIGDSTAMLQTILSRCFLLPLLPITAEQAISYATSQKIDEKSAEQFYMLADGSWSVFEESIKSGSYATDSITEAKRYLQATVFERQAQHSSITKDRATLYQFLKSVALVCKSAMRHASSVQQKQQWKNKLSLTLSALQRIEENGNVRLIALDLSIKL
jgi:hypothetical protein